MSLPIILKLRKKIRSCLYSRHQKGNIVELLCRLRKSKFKITGKGNRITVAGHCSQSRATIQGENNSIDISDRSDFSRSSIQVVGNNCTIHISSGCLLRNTTIICMEDNCSISIGNDTTANSEGSLFIVCMGESNHISIGEQCMFADMVDIWASDTHPVFDAHNHLLNPSRPIEIGNHVWIGRYVRILKGVSIGDGAVIGMSSVVTKNIKPNSLNAGSPCKCIKENISWARDHIYHYEKVPATHEQDAVYDKQKA